jgi:hypothetical protein
MWATSRLAQQQLDDLEAKGSIFASFTHLSFGHSQETESMTTISHLILKHVQNPLPTESDPGPLQPLKFYVLLNEGEYGDKLASMATACPSFWIAMEQPLVLRRALEGSVSDDREI